LKFEITKKSVMNFLMMTAGAVIAAFAVENFLMPNKIFDGGVVGISMVLSHLTNFELGILVVLINIPFLVVGWKKMGHIFVLKVGYSVALFSAMTAIFARTPAVTNDIILAVTFGGVMLGVGVGLVLRGGGCLDGTEIVAVILNRKLSVSIGQVVLIFNVFIYTAIGALYGLDHGMYSLLMYFITSKIIDLVEIGWDNTKSVMIITSDGKGLADEIYKELGRTVTFMRGEGLVSNQEMDILYCVVTRAEIFDLRKIINESPGSTFTTISDVSEIIGSHIKNTGLRENPVKISESEGE